MLALEWTPWRIQKVLLLLGFAMPVALIVLPAMRTALVAHARMLLAGMIGLDLVVYLWASVPFVPTGIDESLFVVNAHALHGVDVAVTWIRTPLPVLGAALTPWHPPMIGILLRGVAAACAYGLGRRAGGVGAGLLAAWWTLVSGHLGMHSCRMLSEPYGAACLALFAWIFVSTRASSGVPMRTTLGLGFVGGLAFACRWQLGVLLVPLCLHAWRGRQPGVMGILARQCVAWVGFAVPILLLVLWTGSDPVRAFLRESARAVPVWDRLWSYLQLDSGLGLGGGGLLLLAAGLGAQLRAPWRPVAGTRIAWLFLLAVASALSIGIVETRFLAPAVPLGAVLMALGLRSWTRCWPWLMGNGLGARFVAAVLLLAVTVSVALPGRLPKTRFEKRSSPLADLAEQKVAVRSLLGKEPLYTDYELLAVTAILGHRCHAVLGPTSQHPQGLSLDFEGAVASVRRQDLIPGCLVLTMTAGGRTPLWQAPERDDGRRLCLVRW